jgi:hypothetical protein
MADGRCFTINTSSRLFNDYVMTSHGISHVDNYTYRRMLQQKGPALADEIMRLQQVGAQPRPNNHVNQCQTCDMPLLKVPHTY